MTQDVDHWIERARTTTARGAGSPDLAAIHHRQDRRAASILTLSKHELRLAGLCAVVCAAVTLWGFSQVPSAGTGGATWIAKPSPISPYGLLIGR
ncbi:MAG: CnrY/NccY family anti-sigma factor [Rubrivivax sp.]